MLNSEITQCDLEPITRLGRIQSFGFLLALSPDWVVTRASANLEFFVGVPAGFAIGKHLDSLVDAEVLHDIRNRLTGLASIGGTERLYGISLVARLPALDLAIHYAGTLCILEGERAGLDSRVDAASLVRGMVGRLGKKTLLSEFHRDAARQIQRMTGFDRVMIYQFAADSTGAVIAEETGRGAESFLGLHYSAADIPVQARALYLLNSFRIIADVGSETVPLIGELQTEDASLDLSLTMGSRTSVSALPSARSY
jgi:light-regulated signal transduction histidine kinase (bacteriophytochrome)